MPCCVPRSWVHRAIRTCGRGPASDRPSSPRRRWLPHKATTLTQLSAVKHQRSKQQMLTGRQRINLIHDGRQMKSHDVCWDVQCRCSPNWGENRIRQTKATTWVKIVMSRPTAHFGLASLFHSFTNLQQKEAPGLFLALLMALQWTNSSTML